MAWNYKPEKDAWVKENQGKHFCQCNCGEAITIRRSHYKPSCGIPRFIQGHQARGELNGCYKGVDKWIKENQGKHHCQCGCIGEIKIMRDHHFMGIPAFMRGHESKADPTRNPMYGRSREKNPAWKGGRKQRQDGYIVILMPDHPAADPNGYVFEHRIVMEKKVGRKMRTTEIVHHINRVRDDNRPENLAMFGSHSAHKREHMEGLNVRA